MYVNVEYAANGDMILNALFDTVDEHTEYRAKAEDRSKLSELENELCEDFFGDHGFQYEIGHMTDKAIIHDMTNGKRFVFNRVDEYWYTAILKEVSVTFTLFENLGYSSEPVKEPILKEEGDHPATQPVPDLVPDPPTLYAECEHEEVSVKVYVMEKRYYTKTDEGYTRTETETESVDWDTSYSECVKCGKEVDDSIVRK